jgi:hypothetical protein
MRKILFCTALVMIVAAYLPAFAASIPQTKSVTIYEPVGHGWEVTNTALLRDRIRLAKNTGFNAIWLVVEWNKLDPSPSAVGEIPLADCTQAANQDTYQCQIERALAVVSQESVDAFIALNYVSGSRPASFDSSVNLMELAFFDNPKKLQRYARFLARLVERNGLGSRVRFTYHDEHILPPYDELRDLPAAQQSFRDYLYSINPSLAFWNSRWGRTGVSSFPTWGSVKTYSYGPNHGTPLDDPQLQDHVAWVNWILQRTLNNGGLEASIRQIIPGALVGMHSTQFAFVNPISTQPYRPQSPIGASSTMNFLSIPYYDGESVFGTGLPESLTLARNWAGSLPIMIGELGSQRCEGQSDCYIDADGLYQTGYVVAARQASFLGEKIDYLKSNLTGFNVWNLSEFLFQNQEGSFGIYGRTWLATSTEHVPEFKPASCVLRTKLGSTSQQLCLANGGVNTNYSPRSIWLVGRGFISSDRVRLSNNDLGHPAYDPQLIAPVMGSSELVTFQVSDSRLAALGCGAGTSGCSIGVEIYDAPRNGYSNKIFVRVN